MSHISTVEVRVNDLVAFQDAVECLGGEFLFGQEQYAWFGKWVGDSPMPVGMTVEDLGKCKHAARFPGASYEVGLRENEDGTFTLVYDYWRSGGLAHVLGGNDLPKLRQAYAKEKVKAEARRLGHAVESEEQMQDGSVRIRLLAAR